MSITPCIQHQCIFCSIHQQCWKCWRAFDSLYATYYGLARLVREIFSNRVCFCFFPPEYATAIPVQCPTKRYIVILFQPVTLQCNYQTSSTQPPIITWKYKSYCRDPIQAALNPSSAENIISQNNPNYDPNIECADNQRTVRTVASKQTNAVTLGPYYQGRKISIINSKLISLLSDICRGVNVK